MYQLKFQDVQFFYMEDGQVVVYVILVGICDQVMVLNKMVCFKEIFKMVEEWFGDLLIFNCKFKWLFFDMDFFYWVDDLYFDFEYYVCYGCLFVFVDWWQFCIYVVWFYLCFFDMLWFFWEIYVIEGFNNVEGVFKGFFGLVIKMYYVVVDGMFVQKFLFLMMDLGFKGLLVILLLGKWLVVVVIFLMLEMFMWVVVNNVFLFVILVCKVIGMVFFFV